MNMILHVHDGLPFPPCIIADRFDMCTKSIIDPFSTFGLDRLFASGDPIFLVFFFFLGSNNEKASFLSFLTRKHVFSHTHPSTSSSVQRSSLPSSSLSLESRLTSVK